MTTGNLPRVAHEQHERLLQTVDILPALGDDLLTADAATLKPRIAEMDAFFTTLLVPHLEAAERTIYPELERMLQNRHSLAPERLEHTEIRSLVASFHKVGSHLSEGKPSLATTLALRRVVFRLYALLKVHLIEEGLYADIVNSGITAEAAEILAVALDHPISDVSVR
jgi:hypothetical protein